MKVPMRIGFGYDVHPLVPGRPLVLGGVTIPYEHGLDGHSDADVVVHALCDAMLGALALGDLGHHFPSTDERWRGVSSLHLLQHVTQLLAAQHYALGNADIAVHGANPGNDSGCGPSADECEGYDNRWSRICRCRGRDCSLCRLSLLVLCSSWRGRVTTVITR